MSSFLGKLDYFDLKYDLKEQCMKFFGYGIKYNTGTLNKHIQKSLFISEWMQTKVL